MAKVKDTENKIAEDAKPEEPNYCFVIMPISDHPDYDLGHFGRVYNHIIRPACLKANFVPIRADEVSGTNMIVIDILQKIINSKMAVCDLSSRNPNVLYELGIRQSFDLPVTLIKDDATDRIFDIQGFRDVFYKKSLRYDEVVTAVDALAQSIKETYENKGKEVNSIVELMGIGKASIKDPVQISPDTEILLNALKDVSQRIGRLENNNVKLKPSVSITTASKLNFKPEIRLSATLKSDGKTVVIGDKVISKSNAVGEIIDIIQTKDGKALLIEYENGGIESAPANTYDLISHPDNLPF